MALVLLLLLLVVVLIVVVVLLLLVVVVVAAAVVAWNHRERRQIAPRAIAIEIVIAIIPRSTRHHRHRGVSLMQLLYGEFVATQLSQHVPEHMVNKR